MLKARFNILASLPIPGGVPDDALTPINIPQPFTLFEFLGNATEVNALPCEETIIKQFAFLSLSVPETCVSSFVN